MFGRATGKKSLEIVHEAERHARQDFSSLVFSVVHGFLGEEDEAIIKKPQSAGGTFGWPTIKTRNTVIH